MMRYYNEENYDGVVIKIPRAIIHLNPGLNKALKYLYKKMDNMRYSTQHPDIIKSLNELLDFDTKSEWYRNKIHDEDIQKRCKELRMRKRKKKLINLDIVELEWSKEKFVIETEELKFLSGTYVGKDEIFTGIKSLPSRVTNIFDSETERYSHDDWKKFFKKNVFAWSVFIHDVLGEPNFKKTILLKIDSWGNLV